MRWERGERSRNIEDRRGMGGLASGGLKIGLGGAAILLVLSLLTGENFFAMLGPGGGIGPPGGQEAGQPYQPSPEEEELASFISFVLDDVQGTWQSTFPEKVGQPYRDAKLVLFNGAVRSGCGHAEAAMGPFYCPADQKAYIDLGFYQELQSRFGAPGDFAQAYVLAHEIGHHVQNLLGIAGRVHQERQQYPTEANALSVRMELQADCFAGVWAHSTRRRDILDPGDVEEGMGAAAAVGDDRIQKQAGGDVHPESWTHGSARQRVAWFRQGFETGNPDSCDTFSTELAADL